MNGAFVMGATCLNHYATMAPARPGGSFGFAWPGQPGNPVGFLAAPGFISLTAWPGGTGAKTLSDGTNATSGSGTALDPWIFKFFDFDALTGGTLLSLSHAKFIGCLFQSNQVANYNVQTTGSDITLSYCSIVPRVTLHAAPPNAAWPSASAGQQQVGNGTGYQISGNNGYQYGLNITSGGPVTADHCDIWGFGNAVVFYSTTAQMTISACWIHDAADAAAQSYHTDGPGYLNNGTAPANLLISGSVVASIGNTNAFAFQGASTPFDKINLVGNYLSGFGYAAFLFETGVTNSAFTDNIFGTDLPWAFGPLHADYTSQYTASTNTWRRNKLKVLPGTSKNAGATLTFTSADDGKFLLPGTTLSTTDFAG